ncbi:hypothetical protein DFP72DRAFT_295995 [Ephemerocybe angulata]|uniref:Transmembrane protein n=1 Tax=Ephemerocybe angulata TaxID=980116 RepID=A0A8H6I1K1_9AGAR|nr:hypothetical protein DFP72DRAFT_295995 [Tulosesus angulatus]
MLLHASSSFPQVVFGSRMPPSAILRRAPGKANERMQPVKVAGIVLGVVLGVLTLLSLMCLVVWRKVKARRRARAAASEGVPLETSERAAQLGGAPRASTIRPERPGKLSYTTPSTFDSIATIVQTQSKNAGLSRDPKSLTAEKRAQAAQVLFNQLDVLLASAPQPKGWPSYSPEGLQIEQLRRKIALLMDEDTKEDSKRQSESHARRAVSFAAIPQPEPEASGSVNAVAGSSSGAGTAVGQERAEEIRRLVEEVEKLTLTEKRFSRKTQQRVEKLQSRIASLTDAPGTRVATESPTGALEESKGEK